jgi:hypothetical protein
VRAHTTPGSGPPTEEDHVDARAHEHGSRPTPDPDTPGTPALPPELLTTGPLHPAGTGPGPVERRPPGRRRRLTVGIACLAAVLGAGALAAAGGGAGADPEHDLAAAPGVQAAKERRGNAAGHEDAEKQASDLAAEHATPTTGDSTTTSATSATDAPGTTVAAPAAAPPAPAAAPPAPPAPAADTAPPPAPAPEPPAPPAPPVPPARRPGGGTAFTPAGPVYWLAASGNDGADGSEGAPWRTFSGAFGRLQPGDTLFVRGGTYGSYSTTQIMNVEGVNGRPGAPITIAAAPGEHVSLIGGGWDVVRVGNSSYVDIRNFDVSGDAQTNRSITNGIAIGDSHHIRIIGNTVHDVGGGGIGTARANHITIDGNHVYNTSMWNENQSSGISVWRSTNIGGGDNADGFSFIIRNNLVHDVRNLVGPITDGNCIIIDSNRDNGYTGSTYIANNVCRGNGGRGVHVFIADNVWAFNNTVVGNLRSPQQAGDGELSAINASNVHFRNNLVMPAPDRATRGTALWQASNITFANNVYTGADHGRLGPSDRLVGDAMVNGDFVPLAGSPAIDAGTPEGAPTTDRRGRTRTGAPDAGAYEG